MVLKGLYPPNCGAAPGIYLKLTDPKVVAIVREQVNKYPDEDSSNTEASNSTENDKEAEKSYSRRWRASFNFYIACLVCISVSKHWNIISFWTDDVSN